MKRSTEFRNYLNLNEHTCTVHFTFKIHVLFQKQRHVPAHKRSEIKEPDLI